MSKQVSRKISATYHIPFYDKNFSLIAAEFDRVASEYETNRLSSWYKAHANVILQTLNNPPAGDILDIGCGTGWLLRQTAKYKKHVRGIGIDISGNMIEAARSLAAQEKIENLEFIHANWEDMDLSNLSGKNITTILCASAFHYFANPVEAANKMFKSLSKGGHFYLLERDKSDSQMTVIWGILHKFLIKDHVRFYHLNELKFFFKNAGFSDILVQKKIRKHFWKKKLFTSIVIISGLKS